MNRQKCEVRRNRSFRTLQKQDRAVKRDRAQLFQSLLFQSLLSLALISFAGLVAFVLLTSARLSQQTTETVEASGEPVVTDRAEWKQFYDAVAGSERAAEIAQPADAVPERRAASDVADVVEVPTATGMPEEQAPGASIPPTATTTLPVAPHSASSELAAKPDVAPAQAAAPPDAPREKSVDAAVSNQPGREQAPQEAAPSVAASEKASPALAMAPVPALDEKTEKSASTTTLPATPPLPMPRPKIAASAPPVPAAARVKQAAPQAEREPERSRPSAPSRARVALPRQRSAPQSDGADSNPAQCLSPLRRTARCHPADRNSDRTFLTARPRHRRNDPARNGPGRRSRLKRSRTTRGSSRRSKWRHANLLNCTTIRRLARAIRRRLQPARTPPGKSAFDLIVIASTDHPDHAKKTTAPPERGRCLSICRPPAWRPQSHPLFQRR